MRGHPPGHAESSCSSERCRIQRSPLREAAEALAHAECHGIQREWAMKNKKSASEGLEHKFGLYRNFVFNLAEQEFEKQVLPLLKKYRMRFTAGNGVWWLSKDLADGRHVYFEPTLFEDSVKWGPVVNLLITPVPGMPANDLGSLMPSYVPEE